MPALIARFPFLSACLGMALLTGMDALVKQLSGGYPTFQIVFMRFAVTAVIIGAGVLALRQDWPRRDRLKAHAGRALLMVVTTSSFFYALGHLPLADVFALSFTSPIFTALFAALFLKEPVGAATAGAIATGFLGMLVIVFGAGGAASNASYPPLALTCALLSPVTYALSIVLLRAQTASEPVTVIVTVQAALVALMLTPVMAVQFVWPSPHDGLVFLLLGALGSAGYLAFAGGLKHISAARFSVVEYTGLLWAAALGLVFFRETPPVSIWLGAGLIIAGCLIVSRSRAPKPEAKAASSSPE